MIPVVEFGLVVDDATNGIKEGSCLGVTNGITKRWWLCQEWLVIVGGNTAIVVIVEGSTARPAESTAWWRSYVLTRTLKDTPAHATKLGNLEATVRSNAKR